jgi:hypothetical protein
MPRTRTRPNGALERFQLEGNAGEQVSPERIVCAGRRPQRGIELLCLGECD